MSWCLRILLLSCVAKLAASSCWYPYIEGVGEIAEYRDGGGAVAFAPLMQDGSSLLFAQGGAFRIGRQTAVSVGAGHRRLMTNSLAVGGAVFFDYSRSHARRYAHFYQATISGELFWRCFEARINGYVPTRNQFRETRILSNETSMSGTQTTNRQTILDFDEQAYGGLDFLVGYNFEQRWGRLRAWGGYYNYSGRQVRRIEGPRVRAQIEVDNLLWWCGTRVIVGGEWQYDRVRGTRKAILLGLRIPLGGKPSCCPCSSICRRMGDPVMRRQGVILHRIEQTRFIEVPLAGIIFIEQNGMGIGTQTDPTNLANAEVISMPGDVIFALADNGDIDVTTVPGGTFILKNEQQFLGFDSQTSVVVTLEDGQQVTVTDLTGAGRARLVVPGGATDAVMLADDNRVAGLAIGGAAASDGGDNAIRGSGVANTIIRNMLIENTVSNGVYITDGTNPIVDSSVFNNIGANAILFDPTTGIKVNQTMIDTTGMAGINCQDCTGVLIANTTINNAGTVAILFPTGSSSSSILINKVTIDTTGSGAGIELQDTSDATVFGPSSIMNTATQGILVANSAPSNSFLFDQVMIDTTGGAGIEVSDVTTVAISQAEISNTANQGILFPTGASSSDIIISRVSIDTTAADAGIELQDTSDVTIEGPTSIMNTAAQGILVGNPSPNSGFNFSGITIDTVGAAGIEMSDVMDVTIAQTDISSATAEGVLFPAGATNTDVMLSTVSVDGATTGYDFNGIDGLTIGGGELKNLTTLAMNFDTISGTTMVNNLTVDTMSAGIVIANGSSTMTFQNNDITTGGRLLDINTVTGAISFLGGMMDNDGTGIVLADTADVVIENTTIHDFASPEAVNLTAGGVASFTFRNGEIRDGAVAINGLTVLTANVDIVVEETTFLRLSAGLDSLIVFEDIGAGLLGNATFSNNIFQDCTAAIAINLAVEGISKTFIFDSNQFINMALSGSAMNVIGEALDAADSQTFEITGNKVMANGGSAPALGVNFGTKFGDDGTLDLTIDQNEWNDITGRAVTILNSSRTLTINALITNNTSTNVGGDINFVDVTASAETPFTNVTMMNNQDSGSGGLLLNADISTGNLPTMCVNAQGNSSDGAGLMIDNTLPGTVQVFDLADIAANNPGIPASAITIGAGVVNTGTVCMLPP